MTAPIVRGAPYLPPSPPNTEGSAKLLSQSTPGHRLPVVDKAKVDPETLQAAQGMEAMFLDYMLKVMRQTVPKSEMDLESPATEIYRGMMDTETAQRAARAGGVGLADQIVAYLQSQRYNQSQGAQSPSPRHGDVAAASAGAPEPRRSTGGTHEGQPDRK